MPSITPLLFDARWHRPWRLLLCMLAAVSAWFAFTPAPPTLDFDDADKVNHLLAFSSMAVAAAFAQAPGRRAAALAAVGLLAYGGFIELVQTQLPTRHGEWADLFADGVGIVAGLLLAAALRQAARHGP